MIAQGRILADDTPAGLAARSKFHNAVSLKLTDASLIAAARRDIDALPEVASTDVDPRSGRLTAFPAPGRRPLAPINRLAEQHGWPLDELHMESGRLDEVFRTITGGASA